RERCAGCRTAQGTGQGDCYRRRSSNHRAWGDTERKDGRYDYAIQSAALWLTAQSLSRRSSELRVLHRQLWSISAHVDRADRCRTDAALQFSDRSGSAAIKSEGEAAMIARLIRWSIANRFLVLLAAFMVCAWGVWSMLKTPLDAIPD